MKVVVDLITHADVVVTASIFIWLVTIEETNVTADVFPISVVELS
jgi:hypothetical protein